MLFFKTTSVCKYVILAGLTLLFFAADLNGQERKWTSSNGKFSVVAELVSVDGDAVKLKRSDNGEVVTVPLSRLSDADQKFLASRNKSKSDSAMESPSAGKPKFKATGKLEWSKFSKFDDDGNELPPDLELVVQVKGKAAAEAFEYGFTKLDKCLSNAGEMKVKEDQFSFNDLSEQYTKIERSDNEFFSDHPKNGVDARFTFEHPDSAVKKFTEVEGSFKIKTGGTRKTIKIENATSKSGKVENKALDALPVTATIETKENSIRLELEGKHEPIIDVQILDPKKKPLRGQNGHMSGGGGKFMSYQFDFDGKVPANATFFLTIIENPEEVTIPFKLSNLKIPAPKKRFAP